MTGGKRQADLPSLLLERSVEATPDYVVRSANAAFERMTGLSRESIQGIPLSELAALAMRAEQISASLHSGSPIPVTLSDAGGGMSMRFAADIHGDLRSSGPIRLDLAPAPPPDPGDGWLERIPGVAALLLERGPSGLRVLRATAAAADRLRLAAATLPGQPLDALVPPETAAAIALAAETVVAAAARRCAGAPIHLPPGPGRWGVTVSHDGDGRVAVMIDPDGSVGARSWQQIAEAGLEAREAIARLMGFAELVSAQDAPGPIRQPADDFAREMTAAGAAAVDRLEAIGEAAWLWSGGSALSEALIDVRGLLHAAILGEAAGAAEAGVVVTHSPGEAAPALRADERRLRDALRYALGFAVSAAAPGGRVVVASELTSGLTIELTATAGPTAVEGGLASPTAPEGSLALSLAEGLLALHGGTTAVECDAGTTRVRLSLPASRIISL